MRLRHGEAEDGVVEAGARGHHGSMSWVIIVRWGRSRVAQEAHGGRLGEVEDSRGVGLTARQSGSSRWCSAW